MRDDRLGTTLKVDVSATKPLNVGDLAPGAIFSFARDESQISHYMRLMSTNVVAPDRSGAPCVRLSDGDVIRADHESQVRVYRSARLVLEEVDPC
jgi:hypothetical protein